MELYRSGFRHSLRILPSDPFDQVVFYQAAIDGRSCNAADACIPDSIIADDMVSRNFGGNCIPGLFPNIQRYRVGPIQGIMLDDPVMPPAGGNHSALGDRKPIGRLFKMNSFNPDISKIVFQGSKDLLLYGNFNGMLLRSVVARQSYVEPHSVVFYPEPAGI